MKVRHEEFMKQYRVVEGEMKKLQAMVDEQKEPSVPRWQDVTGECQEYNGQIYTSPGPSGIALQNTTSGSYRLRKVPVIMHNDAKHDGDAFDTTVRAAFIVEMKVE